MIRSLAIASLISTQFVAGPASAAELLRDGAPTTTETGSFAGARVRLAIGPQERRAPLRAGFVMAPTLRSAAGDGRVDTRFGEGLELGFGRSRRGVALSLAGRPLTGSDRAPQGSRVGVSTIGWIAIGVGALAVLVVAAGVTCQETNCLNSE